MPTLGFLKKKRTKESPGSKDPASVTGTSSQPGSPLTPTTSAGWESLVQSQSARSNTTQGTSNTAETDSGVASKQQTPMTQEASAQQQMYTTSPHTVETPVPLGQQPNLPSINNLINPPQHDGAAQPYTAQMASNTSVNAANGGVLGAQRDVQQLQQPQVRATKGKYTLADFEILRTLGTGSFGRVHLVQSKHNQRFYAVKVLKKQQVVKMKQVEHTNDERRMLQEVKHPFLITLWGTFQDSKNIYMVMDFVEGGELFSLLRKTQVGHDYTGLRNG